MTSTSEGNSELATGRRTRRPRGSLSREVVVEAALALLDSEGIESLSMPRLAHLLDSGVMTLYGYVRSKQELLDAVAMRAIAEVRVPRLGSRDAHAILRGWGYGMRTVLLAHPGVAWVLASRGVVGTGIFRGVELLLRALQAEGFGSEDAVRAVYAVLIYTLGFVLWEVPRVREQPESAYAAQWREGLRSFAAEEFPLVAAGLPHLETVASDRQFEFGLQALVAGLCAASAAPPSEGERSAPPPD